MRFVCKTGSLILLAVLTLAVAGWCLGCVDLTGHECYVALAARGMTSPTEWLDANLAPAPLPEATTFNRWMIPQDNGRPRLRKTPLAYWAAGGLIKAGLPLDEVTVRLPSVIASVLCVLVIFAAGCRMIGGRAALMGALMFAASLALLKWGRSARPELLLMLWMTTAMACFWLGMQSATGLRRAVWLMAGWASMGVANLSKEFVPMFLFWGLLAYLGWRASARRDDRPQRRMAIFLIVAIVGVALVDFIRRVTQWWHIDAPLVTTAIYAGLVGLPLLGYFLGSRPWGQVKLILPTLLPGLTLMLLMFVPWLVYLGHLFPSTGETLWHQVGARGVGDGDSKLRVPGFYLLHLLVLTLPWAVFLPGAVLAPLRDPSRRRPADGGSDGGADAADSIPSESAEHADGLAFLLLWVVGLFVLFSASAGKRPHYILPAVPALCMLMGYAAEDVFFRHRWYSLRVARFIMLGFTGLGVFVTIMAIVASQAASGGWISHQVQHVLDLSKETVTLSDVAGVGRYFVAPMVILAVVLAAGAVAMLKNRSALSFVCLIAAAIGLMVSVAGRGDLLNGSPQPAREADWILSQTSASAPISLWRLNGAEEMLVYYVGRNLPYAVKAREAMVERYGEADGLRRWDAWMHQDGGRWLLVAAENLDEVRQMGYTVVDPSHRPVDRELDVILCRPPASGRIETGILMKSMKTKDAEKGLEN